jgi:hypothetical protein
MAEDALVTVAHAAVMSQLKPPLSVRRGAALLYAVTVDNRLVVRVDPRRPVRGQAAFETDLCVFEEHDGVEIPRVVIEFKPRITTHDVLTYSAKARKHKQIYPYLRYGMIMGAERALPGRFFVHNEALDFALATLALEPAAFLTELQQLVVREIAASRALETIAFSQEKFVAFCSEVRLQALQGTHQPRSTRHAAI